MNEFKKVYFKKVLSILDLTSREQTNNVEALFSMLKLCNSQKVFVSNTF